MPINEEIIRDFFANYAERMNNALGDPPEIDAEATAAAFAGCFVEASPAGINCGKNDEAFLEQIPKGYEHYRNVGTRSMNITSLEITPLDELHALAKVHWDSRYVRKDGKEIRIEFDVFYFVQMKDDTPKIFAYVTGDEQKVMKEHGLV